MVRALAGGAVKGTTGAPASTTEAPTCLALAGHVAALRRQPQASATRTMTVALPPEEALGRILDLGLDGLEPRSVAFDRPLMHVYHEGKVFYERTRDGVVLWRRPAHRWFRGGLERVPYPDVLDVRIEPTPRGSRIEMRWRAHPITRVATRWNAGWIALLWLGALATVAMLGLTKGPLLLCLGTLAVTAQAAIDLARARRALRPLLPRAYAALVPYELGAADMEGSAFRVALGPGRAEEAVPRRRRG